MGATRQTYRYIGPPDLRGLVRPGCGGTPVRTHADFARWVSEQTAEDLAEPFTYVVDTAGVLRLAPRRSEHVVCAEGEDVLGAGEVGFLVLDGSWAVGDVSNQSTGYCPDTASWPRVAEALDRVGIIRPAGFTHPVVFRRCTACRELNIVRDGDFACVFCDAPLPRDWNAGDGRADGPGA
ncbi:MAG TPA: hypothetical protein VLH10_18195 [Yinghuangia sp.]|nr:hypothetical protein [Yinghuangia sp.]